MPVQPVLHLFARSEVWNVSPGDIDQFAAFGVAPGAGRAVVQPKTPETANFDSIAVCQRASNSIKNLLDGDLRVSGDQIWKGDANAAMSSERVMLYGNNGARAGTAPEDTQFWRRNQKRGQDSGNAG